MKKKTDDDDSSIDEERSMQPFHFFEGIEPVPVVDRSKKTTEVRHVISVAKRERHETKL